MDSMQRTFETAIGMREYVGSAAEKEDRKMKMNKSQELAVNRFRRFVEQQDIVRHPQDLGAKITVWSVDPTTYGTFWIKAETELTGLPENNLLRVLDHNYYFVSVGRRGALTMRNGPKSLEQFNGSKAFGINIKI